MELKAYQQQVIQDLETFLEYTQQHKLVGEAFSKYWEDKIGPYNPLTGGGMRPYKNNVPGAASICIKVPTAGGKTFIACNALSTIFKAFPVEKPKAVVWLVPWSNLLDQTVKNLSDPDHPYRQKLDALFNHRVEVYRKDDLLQGSNFNPTVVQEQLTIIVMSFASLRARRKEDRKVYQENGQLAQFAQHYKDTSHLLDNTDETALINVIRSLNPVVVVDESHNAESDLSVDMLQALNPSFLLDLTATPKENSNIISMVPAIELKKEHMVKLPVIVYNHHDKTEVVNSALHLQQNLEQLAKAQHKNGGRYIRPIVLFQAQPRTGEENTTFDKLKQQLLKLGIPEEHIKIKTANKDELKGVDLMSEKCPVRFIITINALKEGWDCPFAYILASLADAYAEQRFNEQLKIGKITTAASWTFPATLVPGALGAPVASSLYEREGSMNNFEQSSIMELSSLPNVLFWHRNLGRGKGFAINGFKSNHYPDFILYTKSGRVVLVETKGDDRDNSDSEAKCRLGNQWAQQAGSGYNYFMVFENKAIEGAYNLNKAKELIGQL